MIRPGINSNGDHLSTEEPLQEVNDHTSFQVATDSEDMVCLVHNVMNEQFSASYILQYDYQITDIKCNDLFLCTGHGRSR